MSEEEKKTIERAARTILRYLPDDAEEIILSAARKILNIVNKSKEEEKHK